MKRSPTRRPLSFFWKPCGAQLASELIILLLLAAPLIAAAGWDLASYTIPNSIQVALFAGFILFAVVAGMTPAAIGAHLLAGFIGLVIGFTFFALGYVGGGDAKLFACVAFWFGLADLLDYALVASVFGGVLTLGLLGFRKFPLPAALTGQGWLMRLHEERAGIPYGVALAASAFALIQNTEIFRIAIAA
jgi:prepilin peptidase CpaA